MNQVWKKYVKPTDYRIFKDIWSTRTYHGYSLIMKPYNFEVIL